MKKKKVALITGITGQDGSYLAEFLINKNYIVHGIKRRTSTFNTYRIEHLIRDKNYFKENNFIIHHGDLTDSYSILRIINLVKPDEIYNLAAQSHVQVSFEQPEYTANADAVGTLRILEAIKSLNLIKKTKFYQASTSEIFGNSKLKKQNEYTPFRPISPYGIAKLYSHWITVNYRESYNMFACNGILFNHESPVRGETFISRKITRGLSRIKFGLQDFLTLGNIYSYRDWGHSKDYVEMMWKMLQLKKPEDFVIASERTHSVKEFINLASSILGFDIEWRGRGLKEIGIDKNTNKTIIKISKDFYRPSELNYLRGDAKKAQKILKWKPKYNFTSLIKEMIKYDEALAKKEVQNK